jgi:hypothetical protein
MIQSILSSVSPTAPTTLSSTLLPSTHGARRERGRTSVSLSQSIRGELVELG